MARKDLAPIILLVYNRLNNTKEVVKNLKKNTFSKQSELYIFSDASRSNKDKEKVEKVRAYLKKIKGFKKIHIIKRDKNYGVSRNMISGVTQIINKKGKVIVLEDDDVPSRHFLEYMNDALDLYEKEEKVGAISGFVFPSNKELPETYFLRFFNSWGWATWKDRWNLFEKDSKKLLSELKKRNAIKSFNLNNTYPFSRILRNQIKGNNDSWSVRWYATLFLNKKLTLFPKKSLIENIGFQEEGTHAQKNWYDKTNTYKQEIKVKRMPLAEDKIAHREIQKYFKSIFWKRFSFKIKRMVKHPLKELKNL